MTSAHLRHLEQLASDESAAFHLFSCADVRELLAMVQDIAELKRSFDILEADNAMLLAIVSNRRERLGKISKIARFGMSPCVLNPSQVFSRIVELCEEAK